MMDFLVAFADGPAAGKLLKLNRNPTFLRAVCNPAGEWDALDMPFDQVCEGEVITVYRRIVSRSGDCTYGNCIVTSTEKDGRKTYKWLQNERYRILKHQPDVGTVRNNDAWQAWTIAAQKKESEKWR